MRYRSFAATAASAALLAAIPAAPAAANHFEGDCTRTKNTTTCVRTLTETRLLYTSFYGSCVDDQGVAGRLQTKTYATVEEIETSTYQKHKLVSRSTIYNYSGQYTTDVVCGPQF